jgi:hypothetical protein
MGKRRYITVGLIAFNIVLLSSLALLWYTQIRQESEYAHEVYQYQDSLNTFKAIAQANAFLLNEDTVAAMQIFRQLDDSSPIAQDWTRKALDQLKKSASYQYALGSLKDREDQLKGNIFQYQDSVMILQANHEAARNDLEDMIKKLDDLSTELDLANALNAELTKQLKKVKASHAQLVFTNEQGKKIRYFGATEDGKASGFGIGIVDEKGIYEGYWKENQRHGKGKYKWANGDTYEGEFSFDKKDGFGKYIFASGERYEGEWKNDLREGKGIIHTKEGKVMAEGIWKNDKFIKNPTADES